MSSAASWAAAALGAITVAAPASPVDGALATVQEAAPAVAGARRSELRREVPLGLDLYMPVPEGNPLSGDKVALGRRLFFDPILSHDGELTCGGCHDPELAFTDARRVAEGVYGRRGQRNVPTLVNRGYGSSFFLDGRAATLEAQVLVPIEGEDELATPVGEAIGRLRRDRDYARAFARVFGREPDRDALAAAGAAYVRSIVSGNAPIDRFRSGEAGALSDLEREGMRIFQGKANCTACHVGPNFTDEEFHNTGVAWRYDDTAVAGGRTAPLDPGRYAITGDEADLGAFKTPTLREIARTAPYMHDGSLATLADVIDFYDDGGRANPSLDRRIRPLRLSHREKAALVAFLQVLSGEVRSLEW